MIKIEHIHTCNWDAAIRSMRNPMNSWDKSDSGFGCNGRDCSHCSFKSDWCGITPSYILGPNDYELALKLAKAGSDHGKFLRSIIFSCDITAPMYWWKEMDTYKVGTVRNSCSTMHKIMNKPFTEEDFSWDKTGYLLMEADQEETHMLEELNSLRNRYIMEKSEPSKNIEEKRRRIKAFWYALIQYLPSSYNQRSTWTANYAVLRNIYHARKNHKLDEWHEFCAMIEKLPYSELITEV